MSYIAVKHPTLHVFNISKYEILSFVIKTPKCSLSSPTSPYELYVNARSLSRIKFIWVSSLFGNHTSSESKKAIYLPLATSIAVFLATAGPLFFCNFINFIRLSLSTYFVIILFESSGEQSSTIISSQLEYVCTKTDSTDSIINFSELYDGIMIVTLIVRPCRQIHFYIHYQRCYQNKKF